MTLSTLEDAFIHELRDLLSAEKQLLAALPRMARAATNPDLREAFESHVRETEQQFNRLEDVFEKIGRTARARKCEAMSGLIEEGRSVIDEQADSDVRDALLIAAAQKVEHYEIAAYGTLVKWAQMLGQDEAADILEQSLGEEKETDAKLTDIAMHAVNQHATAAHAAQQ
jgi:ferritin-like metal-binding protein YciE